MNQKRINLLLTLFGEYGNREILGQEDNPEILKYFTYLGYPASKLKDETAWCAAFASWALRINDLPYSSYLNARSFLNVGKEVEKPETGDLVVFWRESKDSWKGHVGFFIKKINDRIYVLGGNQNNEVNIKVYPESRLLQYRSVI